MSVELATLIVSIVVVAANGLGAVINNRRYSDLRLQIEQTFGNVRERLAILEFRAGVNRKGEQ